MEKRIFSDPSIPGFFEASKKPFKITPQRASSGQVEFLVEGAGIDCALDELYANAQVGALDFLKALKYYCLIIAPARNGAGGWDWD